MTTLKEVPVLLLSGDTEFLAAGPDYHRALIEEKRAIGALLGIAKICELKGDAKIKLDGIRQICAAWNKNRNPE